MYGTLNSRKSDRNKYSTMQRDHIRDGIFVVFICIFISQVYISTLKVIAQEKAVKIRYLIKGLFLVKCNGICISNTGEEPQSSWTFL